jgi:hypothetical protein
MIHKIKDIWDNKGFDILLYISIGLILIFGLFRIIKKEKGSWSKNYYYEDKFVNYSSKNNPNHNPNKKRIPKESKGEAECRRVLNKIFNKPFNKFRPNFLNNPVTGGNFNLELDCYNEELGLAVEYQGKQHSMYMPFFHRNYDHFMTQKYRDDMKRRICKENGITLIEVDYTVKNENIENYLKKELQKNGFL